MPHLKKSPDDNATRGFENDVYFLYSVHLRNNSTVFEELEVSMVDLMVANAVLLATCTH